jgi:dolichol-phosphate mannosyltransferase
VQNVAAYSNKPLNLSIYEGIAFSTFSFLAALYYLFRYVRYGVAVEGFTTLIVSLYFIAGLVLANLGVLGLYVGKSFEQAKARPLYVVRDLRNLVSRDTDTPGNSR